MDIHPNTEKATTPPPTFTPKTNKQTNKQTKQNKQNDSM